MASLPGAILPTGFTAEILPFSINQARSVLSLSPTELLALERGSNSVVYCTNAACRPVASAPRLNHGLAVHENYLYASSDEFVYRWPILDDVWTVGGQETVVFNINRDGSGGAPFGHTTRTLAFDEAGTLYISVGSDGNVDPDSFRSRIRSVDMTQQFPVDFIGQPVFADGLRNEVGLAFDKHGVLWGVENGADNLQRNDLGGDITENNPAEELNKFAQSGLHYGYPYCWTEYDLGVFGQGRGTVWTWPTFLGQVSDDQCRSSFASSEIAMPAHTAPLGITFYSHSEQTPDECEGAFPSTMDGYAFVAFHGSWNRDVPTGYNVAYVPMDSEGNAIGQPIDLLSHQPPNARWDNGLRPVDVDFDVCGRLIVSSDGTRNMDWAGSMILRISYQGNEETLPPVASPVTETETPAVPSPVTESDTPSVVSIEAPTKATSNAPTILEVSPSPSVSQTLFPTNSSSLLPTDIPTTGPSLVGVSLTPSSSPIEFNVTTPHTSSSVPTDASSSQPSSSAESPSSSPESSRTEVSLIPSTSPSKVAQADIIEPTGFPSFENPQTGGDDPTAYPTFEGDTSSVYQQLTPLLWLALI